MARGRGEQRLAPSWVMVYVKMLKQKECFKGVLKPLQKLHSHRHLASNLLGGLRNVSFELGALKTGDSVALAVQVTVIPQPL